MNCPQCQAEAPGGARFCPYCGALLHAAPGAGMAAGELLAGRFRVLRRLGGGGLGEVWLAEDEMLDREPVACKLLRSDLAGNRRALADLKREVLLARRLRHPHILGVYAFWEHEPLRFITMEYAPGRHLGEALAQRGGPFEPAEALPWLRQVAGALDYAHGQGVLHRDVKPGNILIDERGQARLADFSIARLEMDDPIAKAEITCGTLLYMSPEQLTAGEQDARSDQYSLAAAFYELVAGHTPFTRGDLLTQIQFTPASPVAHLDAALNQVLLRGLAKRPEARYPACGAFAEAAAEAIAAAQAPRARPRPRPAPQGLRAEPESRTVVLPAPEARPANRRLGLLLIEAGAVSPAQLEHALAEQNARGLRLGEVLVALGYADEDAVADALALQLGLARARPLRDGADPAVAGMIAPEVQQLRNCLPMRVEAGAVRVAMSDPLDLVTLEALERTFQRPVVVAVATAREIDAAVDAMRAQAP